MKHSTRWLFAAVATLAALPSATSAHFKLLEPASWITEDSAGRSAEARSMRRRPEGAERHALVACGHESHGRREIAPKNPGDDLPLGPLPHRSRGELEGRAAARSDDLRAVHRPRRVLDVGRDSESSANPRARRRVVPALSGPGEPASAIPKTPMTPWETDLRLPNINCPKCTLQVIQFMADHPYNQPGGYSYHHCADLQITADPAKPLTRIGAL